MPIAHQWRSLADAARPDDAARRDDAAPSDDAARPEDQPVGGSGLLRFISGMVSSGTARFMNSSKSGTVNAA